MHNMRHLGIQYTITLNILSTSKLNMHISRSPQGKTTGNLDKLLIPKLCNKQPLI